MAIGLSLLSAATVSAEDADSVMRLQGLDADGISDLFSTKVDENVVKAVQTFFDDDKRCPRVDPFAGETARWFLAAWKKTGLCKEKIDTLREAYSLAQYPLFVSFGESSRRNF